MCVYIYKHKYSSARGRPDPQGEDPQEAEVRHHEAHGASLSILIIIICIIISIIISSSGGGGGGSSSCVSIVAEVRHHEAHGAHNILWHASNTC